MAFPSVKKAFSVTHGGVVCRNLSLLGSLGMQVWTPRFNEQMEAL